jgi:hypothetical protein
MINKTRKAKPARSTARRSRSNGAARVRRYRDKQRAAGLRPVQMWLPDTSDPAVVAEIRRQCRLVRDHPQEKQILAEIEAATDFEGWR